MTYIKFEPLRELDNLNNRLHRFFGEFPANIDLGFSFSPRVDISADDNSIFIQAEIPGVKKEDVKISLQDNILTISGKKKKNEDVKQDRQYFRNEIIYGEFSRSFTLPEDINPDKVEAEFQNGVLSITIEKDDVKAAKERNIEIK
ncbi:MAG TPA: Hsp20/alpha crystallin family protein [Ignavibacteriaceae bacterium]|nr:Hsp20/alpha crystallin family protein [Ignavibacteriaceae bacterium]